MGLATEATERAMPTIGTLPKVVARTALALLAALAQPAAAQGLADRTAGVPYAELIARVHRQVEQGGVWSQGAAMLGEGVAMVRAAYRDTMPEQARGTLRNIMNNLEQPAIALSSLLAMDFANASAATRRFAINTTLGLGGAADRATDMGVVSRRETLGQAVCSYGIDGPFLVLPMWGPTTGVEIAGRVGGIFIGFALFGQYYIAYRISERVLAVVDPPPAPPDPPRMLAPRGPVQPASYEAQRRSWQTGRSEACRLAGLARRHTLESLP